MSEALRFRKVLYADIIRDGGSYEAGFETSDQSVATVFLAQASVDGVRELRHKHLYVYAGRNMPTNAVPVLSASDAEARLLDALRMALGAGNSAAPSGHDDRNYYLNRLEQLIDYACRREPTLLQEIEAMKTRNGRLLEAIESGIENGCDYLFDEPFPI